jgi:hypothetical protein
MEEDQESLQSGRELLSVIVIEPTTRLHSYIAVLGEKQTYPATLVT